MLRSDSVISLIQPAFVRQSPRPLFELSLEAAWPVSHGHTPNADWVVFARPTGFEILLTLAT
jgi:hypothetical protein